MFSKNKINEKKNALLNIINYEGVNKVISLIIYNLRKLIGVYKNRFKSVSLYKCTVVRKFVNIKFLIGVLKDIFGFIVRNIGVVLYGNIQIKRK